jgi:hypothetical protein
MPNVFSINRPYGGSSYGTPAPFGFGSPAMPPFTSDDLGANPPGPPNTPSAANLYGGDPMAPVLNVGSDGSQPDSYPLPGFTPVPPDIFAEWRKHAERGLTGLLNAYKGHGNLGGNSGGWGDDEDCQAEWNAARRRCVNEVRPQSYSNRGLTGGYRSIEDCARGFVSRQCGGNTPDYGKE